jgi:Flp pilus assembly protein TadB
VALTVAAIISGLLVPRWVHRERITDKDRQITALQAALDKRDDQVTRLAASGELTVRLLEDIKREAARR